MTASTCVYCGLGLGLDAELVDHIRERHGITVLQHADNMLRSNPDGTQAAPTEAGELFIPTSDVDPLSGGYL